MHVYTSWMFIMGLRLRKSKTPGATTPALHFIKNGLHKKNIGAKEPITTPLKVMVNITNGMKSVPLPQLTKPPDSPH